MPIRISELLEAVPGLRLRQGSRQLVIGAISHDSREIGEADCFVALRGAKVDGHRFIEQAIASGAAAIVLSADHQQDYDVAVLEADEPRRLLGAMGAAIYGDPSRQMVVVGITGTNGKTSSSFMLDSVASYAGVASGVIGTTGYRWPGGYEKGVNTTPDGLTLQRVLREMADDGVEHVYVEVSSHALQLGRVSAVDFDVAIFTNLSQDHLGFHGDMEHYRQCKWSLFTDYLPGGNSDSSVAVINVESQEGIELARALEPLPAVDVLRVATDNGLGKEVDFVARDIALKIGGSRFEVSEGEQRQYGIELPIPGRFNVENALGVIATLRRLGLGVETIVEGMAKQSGLPGRMETVEIDGGVQVVVDYAHTPDALEQALSALAMVTEGKLWVVFGCGGDRDKGKRPMMGEAAIENADRVVLTSDNPRSEDPEAILDAIEAGIDESTVGGRLWRIADRREAIRSAVQRAAKGDVVLIAGKGHETMQEIDGKKLAFDDRDIARQAMAEVHKERS